MVFKLIVKGIAFILISILAFPFSSFAAQEEKQTPDAKPFVSKIIEAYGGRKKIENIKTVYASGKINAFMRGDRGKYVLYFKRDRKLRLELSYSRSPEIRILNGGRGWRGAGRETLMEVSNNRYLAMVFQYKRLDLPHGLLTGSYTIEDAGSDVINDKKVRVFELGDSEGPRMKIYVDAERFYIVKVSGFFMMGQLTTELSAEYSDFRVIDGTPFPYRIINYAGGHKVGETIMEKYSVNSGMDDSIFSP